MIILISGLTIHKNSLIPPIPRLLPLQGNHIHAPSHAQQIYHPTCIHQNYPHRLHRVHDLMTISSVYPSYPAQTGEPIGRTSRLHHAPVMDEWMHSRI